MTNRYIILSLCLISAIQFSLAQKFTSEDIRVTNHAAGITLGATLTAPSASEPFAVMVLASGSGAQNRDEEIFGHKPFKAIAEHLSENGYAVLRMDDRGTGESEGNFQTATIDDFATDISAGVKALSERYPAIPIGIVGHSEGGITAIRLGSSDPECDFIITLAAPAWAGDSIIMSQSRAFAVGMTGKWDGEEKQREILDIVKSDLSDIQARMSLSFLLNGLYGENAHFPKVQENIARQLDVLVSPWYRRMIKYNPANDISSVGKPWLALNGVKDTQVLPGNLATIKQLNQNADTMLLPGHNHLFLHAVTGLPDEYTTLSGDISDETLSAILSWLDNHFAHNREPRSN